MLTIFLRSPSLVTLLTLAWVRSVVAQPSQPTLRFDGLSGRIDSLVGAHKTPGAQVLIFTKDSLLYKHNAGVTNLKTGAPVTDQSMFSLASITKSLVGVSALMLIERGQLKLSDELKKLAPDIGFTNPWEATDPVRIVHLLEHTSGFADLPLNVWAYNKPLVSLETALSLHPEARRSRWRPGTFMAYSNWGAPMVARVIEKQTGQEFESFVRQRIFNPLIMRHATFRYDGLAPTRLVTNYWGNALTEESQKQFMSLLRPAGGLKASALEWMPFVQMLMNRGTYRGRQLLQPTSVARMETPTTTLAAQTGSKQGYGLGNATFAYKGWIFHGHNGEAHGGMAQYFYNTDLDRGLIVLANSDQPAPFFTLCYAVLDVMLQGLAQPLPPLYAPSLQEKASLLGYYRQSNIRYPFEGWSRWLTGIMRVYEQGGQLFHQYLPGGRPTPLRPVGPGQFIHFDDWGNSTQLTLTQNDAGQTVFISNRFNATKTSGVGVWLPLGLVILALLVAVVCLVGLAFIWPIRYAWLKRQDRRLSALAVRLALGGYAVSLITFLWLYSAYATERADIMTAGLVTPDTVMVFIASVFTAVFAAWALVSLVRQQGQIPNRADRAFLWLAVGSALLVTGYLAAWGQIGLRTWA